MKNYDFDARNDLNIYGDDTIDRASYVHNFLENLVRNARRIDEKQVSLDEKRDYVEDIIKRIKAAEQHVDASLMSPASRPDTSSDFLAGMKRGLNLCIAMFNGDKVEIKNLEILREMEQQVHEEMKIDRSPEKTN